MDRIEIEKSYPQKVEIVNEINAKIENSSANPLPVALDPNLITGTGSSMSVRAIMSGTNTWVFCRPAGTNRNLHVSSVHVVNAGVGYIFPLDLWVYTLSASAVQTSIINIYTSYAVRFQSATSIVIFYETVNSSGTVDALSYSSSD